MFCRSVQCKNMVSSHSMGMSQERSALEVGDALILRGKLVSRNIQRRLDNKGSST